MLSNLPETQSRAPSRALLLSLSLSLLAGCKDKASDDSGGPIIGGTDSGPTQPIVVTAGLEAAIIDECRDVCGSVSATGPVAGLPFAVESNVDGFVLTDGVLDDQGQATFCLSGLSPGSHALAISVDTGQRDWAMVDLDVRPFGYAYGLDRPTTALTELPWVPGFTAEQLTADPVFSYGDAGTWDSMSALAPSTVWLGDRRLIYYAGTDDEAFKLGVASSTNTATAGLTDIVRYDGNPILTADQTGAVLGDWDYYAQNTPEAMVVDGELWLYYNGRSETDGGLNIGLATSTDGFNFARVDGNPVLAPTGVDEDFDGAGVAHPSVLTRAVDFADNEAGASQVFELWYASGTLQIGYAISADGVSFERFCKGVAFGGTPGSWDLATVKAPEVAYEDGVYQMTYSGCGLGCYQVGWAASTDGSRWVSHDSPIIPTQEAPTWNSYGTQEAFLEVDEGLWRFWYVGTGVSHGQVGVLELEH